MGLGQREVPPLPTGVRVVIVMGRGVREVQLVLRQGAMVLLIHWAVAQVVEDIPALRAPGWEEEMGVMVDYRVVVAQVASIT